MCGRTFSCIPACNLIDGCLFGNLPQIKLFLVATEQVLCVLLVGQHFAQYFPFFFPPTLTHSFGFAAILLLRTKRGFCWEEGGDPLEFERGFIQ